MGTLQRRRWGCALTALAGCSSPISIPSDVGQAVNVLTVGGGRLRAGRRLTRPRPYDRLSHDQSAISVCQYGSTMEFVAKVQRVAHAITERGIVGAGEDSISRQSVGHTSNSSTASIYAMRTRNSFIGTSAPLLSVMRTCTGFP